ncbi:MULTISPECIES: glycosyltransferase [unclassified Paraburkholderia]|uniref:glycosyltransferase family protein n=1 Tax=unclassified Paraburkholderia TaxID=2615204 RepID=UPI00160B9F43|nr:MULTISPECIES: glycosyltransferase [unclassified Paraburkholderia]MBB5445173.1 hypothetical protein [Paraburkholderia sp. WSM4177]MBB5485721.1 hypothetical protein [Paraburkholderia sp. WSM4180]
MNENVSNNFKLPTGLIGRFAVVKLWPKLKTAEDECIARLKIAAAAIGVECIEIHADGTLLADPNTVVCRQIVDFVLHLHYDTPKYYDVFSFVALWNPLQFYHEWGYQRTSRNLLSHDDFVSCSSAAADDHVARMVRNAQTHLPAHFKLYHSLADIARPPSLGDHKLFYVGINWEAVNGGQSRHQDVLKRLDQTGMMRIYGPSVFLNVKVWAGYQSYVKEIPFDGVSMIEEISKAGVSLVLSSAAHKESGLMSNRLFESVAAGTLVICDENRFASKYFGDALLYIDSRCSVDKICEDIQAHLAWAKANPELALAKIEKAQRIFREKFSLVRNLSDLYLGFQQRKEDLLALQGLRKEATKLRVGAYFLVPEFSKETVQSHLSSLAAQDYRDIEPVLVIDRVEAREHRAELAQSLVGVTPAVRVLELDFFDRGPTAAVKGERKLGNVIAEIVGDARDVDALMFVAPNERLLSNHVQVLAGSLIRDPQRHCAATAAIIKNGEAAVHTVSEQFEFGFLNDEAPIGYARLMFRRESLPANLCLALPYLHGKPLAALVGEQKIQQEIPSTVIIDILAPFPRGKWNEGMENELLGDFCPEVFTVYRGYFREMPSLAPRVVAMPASVPYSRLSRRWVLYQIEALREKGVGERLNLLRTKIGRRVKRAS